MRGFTINKFYTKIISPARAAAMPATDTHAPYLINAKFENFSPDFLVIDENIIPASAPTGVNSAPRLEPITVAYTAAVPAPPALITEAKSMLIGMLFTRLEATKEHAPYSHSWL